MKGKVRTFKDTLPYFNSSFQAVENVGIRTPRLEIPEIGIICT
jgi:hypothetical protein